MKPLPQIRCAVIGGSLDGKTYTCAGLSRGLWRYHGFRSVAFDPYKGETPWGPQCLVLGSSAAERAAMKADEANRREFQRFRALCSAIRPEQKIAVFWDEATDHGGRDRENKGMLTAIRHNSRASFIIAHDYAAMLPGMRGSLSDVILFARPRGDAEEWADIMVDPSLIAMATGLRQYEFVHKRKHEPARVVRFTPAEIERGVTLW